MDGRDDRRWLLEIHTGFGVVTHSCFVNRQAEVCFTGLTPADRDINVHSAVPLLAENRLYEGQVRVRVIYDSEVTLMKQLKDARVLNCYNDTQT